MNISRQLPEALLPWYAENKRDLPWRRDRDPYHIWISEIMLQQTRVEAVKEYYIRFLTALPDLAALADCDDELLMKLWEGLGYYSRVRNLKKAACVICEQYQGQFPSDYQRIHDLPGVGDYTTGAIMSIAFSQPVPAVDGNVMRVVSRLMNDPTPIDSPVFKKEITKALEAIYPADASSFTQALMELGATVCGPNHKPDCMQCPCRSFCRAVSAGTQDSLPVKNPKKAKQTEEWTVLILRSENGYAFEKRPSSGILAGMWQFPMKRGFLEIDQVIDQLESDGITVTDVLRQVEKKHIFTHKVWNMRGYYLNVKASDARFSWFSKTSVEQLIALPTAFKQFWDEIDNT